MEKLETVPAKKNVFNILTSLVSAIDKEEIYEQLAEIIQELQSVFILKKKTPFMTGVVGAPPETKALCKVYATHTADVAAKRDQMEMLSLPTIWEEKEGTVYKGDFCPLMGKWFWSPIAKCSCSQNKCGGVGHNQSDRKENLESSLDACIDQCKIETCYPDDNTKTGCNQMFNCPQACKMRDLGLSRTQCRAECQRTGESGCYPVVQGFKFNLCSGCNREGCSRWPSVEECVAGCDFY